MSGDDQQEHGWQDQPRQESAMRFQNHEGDTDETEAIAKRAADLAESRVMLKFAWFLIANVASLIGVGFWVMTHIYALEKDVSGIKDHVLFNDGRIERLTDANVAQDRNEQLFRKEVNEGFNDIRRLFYEHDRTLANQRNEQQHRYDTR